MTPPSEPLTPRPSNRQELYDTIRKSSKEQFIIDDMKRLGYWEKDKTQPTLAEQLMQRETQLHRELNALVSEKRRVEDREALLKQMRKERMAESRRKREENKQKRLAAIQQKKEAWKATKDSEIGYLGQDVSGGLSETQANAAKLQNLQIPVFNKPSDLAKAMNLTVSQLRFLAFNRTISKVNHYRRFSIAKKTGGTRTISAPMFKLKDVQHWLLENILNKIPVHDCVHGFVAGRSIVSNAAPHTQAVVLVNFDLKDFFPTVTYRRVKGLFKLLGYSEAVATVIALICTEANVDEALLDGEKWYIGNGERHLPQGAPTSPAITNILCQKMDKRLAGLAQKLGFTYTRYADDLSFSSKEVRHVNSLKQLLPKIVAEEGFMLHPDKTKVMRSGAKKEVTGVTVNDKLGVDRKTLKKFRAALHQLEKNGGANVHWGQSPNVIASVEGYANFVLMVDREKGGKLKEKVNALMPVLLQSHQRVQRKSYPKRVPITAPKPVVKEVNTVVSRNAVSQNATQDNTVGNATAKKPWWKFWG